MNRQPMQRCASALLMLVLAGCAPGVQADGLARLRAFMDGARAGQAEFTQQLTSRDGKVQAPVSGSLAFQRPGHFRWDIQKPYRQLIVADGERIWLWDPDLNQATVKVQDKALGASPAALLAGDNTRLERDFSLQARAAAEGLEWVEATPRSNDAGFDSILMGFAGNELARMDLKDSFGQRTRIQFSHFQPSVARGAEAFRFKPPAGADVVRE